MPCNFLQFGDATFSNSRLQLSVILFYNKQTVDAAVQQDIRNEKALEEKQRMEQMPKGSIHERLAWGIKKSEMENQQRKKNKSKNREMER